jgi:hypothetical protein
MILSCSRLQDLRGLARRIDQPVLLQVIYELGKNLGRTIIIPAITAVIPMMYRDHDDSHRFRAVSILMPE